MTGIWHTLRSCRSPKDKDGLKRARNAQSKGEPDTTRASPLGRLVTGPCPAKPTKKPSNAKRQEVGRTGADGLWTRPWQSLWATSRQQPTRKPARVAAASAFLTTRPTRLRDGATEVCTRRSRGRRPSLLPGKVAITPSEQESCAYMPTCTPTKCPTSPITNGETTRCAGT